MFVRKQIYLSFYWGLNQGGSDVLLMRQVSWKMKAEQRP